jgi:HAD superfamily hydrolase (TIGR01490 family)
MALALFDLDRTLLSVNAGQLWVRRELRLGYIGRWQATKAAAWIFGYHLGFSRMEKVLEDAIATLGGEDEADVVARTLRFYDEEVAHTYRPRAREVVEKHRARGDTLALLTSTSIYLAGPVQAALGIEHALCNRFEVAGGRFTGRAVGTLCFGAGKLGHATSLAERLGERLADATFYTDSASDLAVLDAVGHPVAVHPDPTLARIARKRGWPIEDWGTTTPARSPSRRARRASSSG